MVRIASMDDGRKIRVVGTGPDRVRTMAFSTKGKSLAVRTSGITEGCRYVILDVTSSRILTELRGESLEWSYVGFSPNDRLFVELDTSGRALIWDTENGRQKAFVCVDDRTFVCGVFSPDSKFWISGSGVSRKAARNGFHSGRSFRAIGAASPAPRGNLIGEIKIWDVETGRLLHSFIDPRLASVTALAFHPNGRTLVTGDREGQISFLDYRSADTDELGR